MKLNPTPLPRLFIPTTERLPSRSEALKPAQGEFNKLLAFVRRKADLVEVHFNPDTEKFYSWDDGSEVKNVAGWIPSNVDVLQARLEAITKADRLNLVAGLEGLLK